jgi:hypothetical protein
MLDTAPGGLPWPRLSVVMPTYNRARFLEEAVRSVLLQGYPNLQYIIIDGGSTDGSIEILRKYDRWISYWTSEPDQGSVNAINKGLRLATGNAWGIMQSDDRFEADALRQAATILARDADVEWVYGKTNLIGEDGTLLSCMESGPLCIERLIWQVYFTGHGLFVRRSAAGNGGRIFDERFRYASDWDFFLRLATRAKSRFIPQVLGCFRQWPGSLTTAGEAESYRQMSLILMEKVRTGYFDPALELTVRKAIAAHCESEIRTRIRSGEMSLIPHLMSFGRMLAYAPAQVPVLAIRAWRTCVKEFRRELRARGRR